MGFNEKIHAYISAKFYVYLTEAFGTRGEQAFIHATQYYAGQRGRRMAQRAIRDGKELNHAAFMQYGELAATTEVIPADGELISLSPDYELHITNCPWHDQFKEMGLSCAGNVYCTYLDEALCRGFNPQLDFRAEQNLNTSDYCIHKVMGTNYDKFPDAPPKEEYKRDFDYHCGHSYWSYCEVVTAIFGEEGEKINAGVLRDFIQDYGYEMAEKLKSYSNTNFNVC